MSGEFIVAVAGASLAVLGVLFVLYKKLPKRMKTHKNIAQWRNIQKLLADQRYWPQAVMEADELLDKIMRHRRCEGKTMGERMVSCQNIFSNNDELWKSHKLANKIRDEETQDIVIGESEMKATMMAFGQAMKDLGAL